MATKKYTRAKKAATATTVNAWENDPGNGSQPDGGNLLQLPVPQPGLSTLPTIIRQTIPPAGIYSPGTNEFRYWNLAVALTRGSEFWSKLLPGVTWQPGKQLPVEPDFGEDFNAYYDRIGLKFFHGDTHNRRVFSGESPDVICHEQGHAILDAIKPQLWDAASIEIAAFHESFGDMAAILCALQLTSMRHAVIVETKSTIYGASRLSRLAEQLGWAIRQLYPSLVEPDCLRNAVNAFFYQDPGSLPSSGPSNILSSEPHSFSRVFTAAFFEGLANMFKLQPTQDESSLLQVCQEIAGILISGVKAAPVVPAFFSQVASAMIQVANQQFTKLSYGTALRSAFVRHGIISAATAHQFSARADMKTMGSGSKSKKQPKELPKIRLAMAAYGLGADTIIVHAAGEARQFNVSGAALAMESVTVPSHEDAAKAFVEDLLRRGRLKLYESKQDRHMSMAIMRPNQPHTHDTHTHGLKKEKDGLVLRRLRIDCCPHQ